MPCISVIVPTYNVLPYLDRSMTSLLGQTHRDLDILLIDDGATDGCAARCDAYARQDPRVRVVHQPNGGLSSARNTGLDHAVGDFVAFLDPDDYADPHMLERLLTTLTQAQADTCFCRYYDVSADGSVRLAPEDYARSLYTGAEIDQLLLGMVGSRPHHPHDVEIGMSVWKGLYSLPILRAHHIRFLSEREYLSEDLLFHLDYLAHAGAVAIVPEPLYYYCQNPASLTGVYRADKAFLGRVRRCIAQEAAHNKNSLRNIAAICRDPLVQAVLRELDESQLPRLKRVLHWAIQHHCALFLYGAFRLRSAPAPQTPAQCRRR